MTRLKDVAFLNQASLPETTDPDRLLQYVDIGSVDSAGQITGADELTFEEAPSRARRLVRPGDSILSTVRTYLRAIAHIGSDADELVVSTGFATLTPRHGVHPRFLFWALRSDVLIEDVVARSVGVSYPAITATELGTLPISVPSIDRQMQVSNYLDDETSRIDELISEQEWQLRLIAEHRHALLSQAVSARVGGGRSTLDGALGALPDGWRLVPLKAVATIQSGLTLGKSYEGPLELRPYIRVANVQDGYIDTDDVAAISLPREVLRRHELRTGDVLINEGNGNPANLGRGAIWDGSIPGCVHQNHVFAIRPGESVRPLWIEFLLASSAGRAYFVATSSQVGIASTNRAKVGRFPVPLPRVEEQDRILGNVRDRLGRLDAVREEVSAQIALLREHRQALITMAVGTGLDALRGVA